MKPRWKAEMTAYLPYRADSERCVHESEHLFRFMAKRKLRERRIYLLGIEYLRGFLLQDKITPTPTPE